MSTFNDQNYFNDTSQEERAATLKNDTTQGGGISGDTYLSRAARSIGAELGGRFAHLGSDQTVVGTGDPQHRMHSMQPADGYWGANSRLPDEPPLGFSIEAVPDTSKVDVNR
jgi:hypothetical protein